MKILHLSNFDGGDGASIAAGRLHAGLLRCGHDSTMFVAERRTDGLRVERFAPANGFRSRLRHRVRSVSLARNLGRYRSTRPAGRELFSDDRTPYGGELVDQLPDADVITVHTIRRFADYAAFFEAVPRRAPIVRTLHDMNFFTGGCHTNEGCQRYMERCGACPQLGSSRPNDLSRKIWQRKREGLSHVPPGRLHVVAASEWMAQAARRSSLARNLPIRVIPFGLDTEVYSPKDSTAARAMLGIPQDTRILLFVAEPLGRRIKGFAFLAEALEGASSRDRFLLVTMGSGATPVPVPVPHLPLGHIRNEHLRAMVYSVADLCIVPSLQENFPLTALEAVACGTPVVASATGGLPEIVRPEVTGLLAPVRDVAALRTAIVSLLNDRERHARMRASCRQTALAEYGLDLYVSRYVTLYEELLRPAQTASAVAGLEAADH